MNRAEAISLDQGVRGSVSDRGEVQAILELLNHEVVLEPYAIPYEPSIDVQIRWPNGMGPVTENYRWTWDYMALALDPQAGTMGLSFLRYRSSDEIALQWAVPDEFVAALLSSRSGTPMSPTQGPPEPTRRYTLSAVPGVHFDHPSGELTWGGPDGALRSFWGEHCGAPDELERDFGVPDLFRIEKGDWFSFTSVVPRENAWRWTGYYYREWQVWQGDSLERIFLVHRDMMDFAFQYQVVGCS